MKYLLLQSFEADFCQESQLERYVTEEHADDNAYSDKLNMFYKFCELCIHRATLEEDSFVSVQSSDYSRYIYPAF